MPWLTVIHAVHFAAAAARLGFAMPLPAQIRALGRQPTHEDTLEAGVLLDYLERVTDRAGRDVPVLAAVWATDVHSPLIHLASALPTAGDGVAVVLRFLPLVTDLYRPALRDDGDEQRFLLEVDPGAPRRAGLDHAIEFEIGSLWAAVRLLYPQALPWVAVDLPAADAPCERYAEVLGCPVRAGCATAAIVFRPETLAAKTRQPNEVLGRFLRGTLDRRLAATRTTTTAAARVRTHLLTALPHDATARDCARALGWSERTLHRRLAGEAISFRRVLDQVRADLAEAWMPYEGVEVIAERLGYADGTSFARAYRRWGRT
jgi:AraC-like DNA-binding protein